MISSEPPLAVPHAVHSDGAGCHNGLLPGDRLEHFELLEFIGGGGMGRVFRARDTRLGRAVALKVLAPGQAEAPDALARFQNEAQSAARLDHENIARVFHVGEDRGLHYIVFEHVEGVNLRALVYENGPLPLADAMSYTVQIAEALAHSADRDVVHRDIKPSNVLVTPAGRAKLIDMGLARLHKIDTVAADLTASGVTLGTFDYISPEQARDPRNADVRSDIYSLGCTFFFTLTGRPPFPEGTVLQKLLQHQGDEPPNVRQFRPDTPDGLIAILRRMLAKDPRNRYQTPSELLDDLTIVARQLGLRPLSTSGHVWELPRPPRISPLAYHLPWLAPTVALLCVVAALHVLGGSDSPPPPLLGTPEEFFGEALPDPAEFAWPSDLDEEPATLTRPADPLDGRPQVPPEERLPRAEPREVAPEAKASDGPLPAPDTSVDADTLQEPSDSAPAPASGAERPSPEPASQSAPPDTSLEGDSTGDPATPDTAPIPRPGEPVEDSRRAPEFHDTSNADATLDTRAETDRQAGVLVVHGGDNDQEGFASLAAALAVAETGNVIELRYNGPRDQAPVKLTNRRLTIRGGEGFQPIVVFPTNGNDPIRQPRSMITLSSGELGLVNLAFELDVSDEVPVEKWSLFEVAGGARVSLQRCTLSIVNTSDKSTTHHSDVAFFRVPPAPGADRIIGDDTETAGVPAVIELVDCAARGQAALLRAESNQSVRFDWDNGLLATSEPLAFVAAGLHAPAEGDSVAVNLRHLTARVGGSLLAMPDRQPAARQVPTGFVLSNSIVTGAAGVPLVDQYAAADEDPRGKLRFQGNRNFYEGIDVFWRLRGAGDDQPVVLFDFDAWQSHWGHEDESFPSLDRVVWKEVPSTTTPAHRIRVADFVLAPDAATNPARGAASNGRDAGCDPARLPEFP